MNIVFLLVTNVFSGAENVSLQLANSLKNRHNTIYCSPEGPVRSAVENCGVTFLPIEKVTVAAIKKIYKEYCVHYFHACDYRVSLLCAFAKVPFVSHLHANPPWLQKRCVQAYCMSYFAKHAKHVICVSQSILDEYIFSNKIKHKCVVIGNVVDADDIINKSLLPANIKLKYANYELGFIGRMCAEKQPDVFVKLVAKLQKTMPDIKAVMIGAGPLEAQIKDLICSMGLEKTVELCGFCKNPFPILNKCKIVVMPSIYEGFGLTAVESMVLGKPVLASPVGGLVNIVDDSCGFLCKDYDDFTENAKLLLSNNELYTQKTKSAQARAKAFSNINAYTKEVEQLYHKYLSTIA